MFSWQQKKNAIKDIDIKINVLNVTANRAQRPMYFMQKSLVCFMLLLIFCSAGFAAGHRTSIGFQHLRVHKLYCTLTNFCYSA